MERLNVTPVGDSVFRDILKAKIFEKASAKTCVDPQDVQLGHETLKDANQLLEELVCFHRLEGHGNIAAGLQTSIEFSFQFLLTGGAGRHFESESVEASHCVKHQLSQPLIGDFQEHCTHEGPGGAYPLIERFVLID